MSPPITAVDDIAPLITVPSGSAGDATSAIRVNENTTAVATFTANETVTWSLNGGADASKFSIDASTGELVFQSAPDYETPTDSDGQNTYVVVVKATDTPRNMSTQTVTVTVTVTDLGEVVVILVTPKLIRDFEDPLPSVSAFFDHYGPLVQRASKTIVILAVGNTEHMFQYRGSDHWDDPVSWARFTEFRENPDERPLDYYGISRILNAFRSEAERRSLDIALYDQVDQGREFAETRWKDLRHSECLDRDFEDAFRVWQPMRADSFEYVTAPGGIAEGTLCGDFMIDQASVYMSDLSFDGLLFHNQLGTRGHWLPDFGPGWTPWESAAIQRFVDRARERMGERELIWFDSYNPVPVEFSTWSWPSTAYGAFDYILASGFAVITETDRYRANLRSKLDLSPSVRVLATLDYADPWYFYNSATAFPDESERLEEIALQHRSEIAGFFLFGHDEKGDLIPSRLWRDFSDRFWGVDTP